MTRKTWDQLNYIHFLTRVKYEKAKTVTPKGTKKTITNKVPECYKKTLDSLICLFQFIDNMKKQFEYPLSRLPTNKEYVYKLMHRVSHDSNFTSKEKEINEKLRIYFNSIKKIQKNFQCYAYQYDSFHYEDFIPIIEEFPKWNISNVNISLEITNEKVEYGVWIGHNAGNLTLDPFQPELDFITKTLQNNFQKQLNASSEANKLIESLNENVSQTFSNLHFIAKRKAQKKRNKLFRDLRLKLNIMIENVDNNLIDEFNNSFNSIFLKIGTIAGNMADVLSRQ